MENLVNSLMKMTPEESETWILQMAQHAPPPGVPKPQAQTVTDQVVQGATMPQVNMGQIVNPLPAAPAYVAPQGMASLSPEQMRSLATQGERTPVPKMSVPSAPGVHNPGQVSVAPNAGAPAARSPVAPRMSLAQLLGR